MEWLQSRNVWKGKEFRYLLRKTEMQLLKLFSPYQTKENSVSLTKVSSTAEILYEASRNILKQMTVHRLLRISCLDDNETIKIK
jgi:hypothetical protein